MNRLELAQFNDLKRQLELIKQSSNMVGGSIENQISSMALLMTEVAQILQLPADQTMRQLPAWAAKVMSQMPKAS